MNHNENPNIDELLNSYLDGELDPRQRTEVQRMLKHDERIAERLQSLQKCQRLVSSLPYAEAPDGMLENIKSALQQKKSPVTSAGPVSFSAHRQRQGQRHLFFRRLTAVAAMFALVAVLAAVIYSIIAPETIAPDMSVAVKTETLPKEVAAAAKPLAETEFSSQLELRTTSPSEVVAFINKAIEFSIPSGQQIIAGPDMLKESHVLTCSRQNLRSLIADLATIWDKIDSATLFIDTGKPEGQIVINAITPDQIIEIAKQGDFQTQIKTAKFFAAMNNMTELLPGKDVMLAIEDSTPPLLTIPKPVLTSNEKPVTKAAETEAQQKVLLTIVVTAGE